MLTENQEKQARLQTPAYLAFLGDAVYSLSIREFVIQKKGPVGEAHKRAALMVSAPAQARAYTLIEPSLTEAEQDIFRRGRNLQQKITPQSATVAEYHTATGLEALFGYLYLAGKNERILELIGIVVGQLTIDNDCGRQSRRI